ncbi:amino acid adenylation domain-containing protein [Amycolatopsis sacchari]|uniref:amino acid adenylation domain-containing protein n=1 Tax=Amycolatopsis sacchari TaxID=115433 RepID=UPI003D7534D0
MSETGTVNPSPPETDDGPSLCGLVRRRAESAPGADAVVDHQGGTVLTYAALVARAGALAGCLRDNGIGPEAPVAVLLRDPVDTIVTMLAVLDAGGVYCPLDPTAPERRTTALLRALRTRVAVADQPLPDVTVLAPGAAGTPGESVDPGPGALAYVLHTSGSTGTPKGVAMPHRGLSRLIRWQVANGEPGLRTLQFTATSFDVTFQEVLSTLVTGGSLVVAPEELRRDPGALLDTIVERGVERLFLPYVALQLLADAAQRRGVVPSSLRHVVTAGERLVITSAIRNLFAALPHCRLDNHYGPTEAHLVTSHTLPADVSAWPAAPPIGAPVDGVGCHVLDESLRPVPGGEAGELYVSGAGLARGYLHDPRRTAERFVPGPSGERLYRTGDLVRQGPQGYEFVGRTDGQLKVRGFRVEPAEVEQAITSHPRVIAAAVGLREVTEGMPVLVAYVQSENELSARELTEHLGDLVPPYMIPARYVTVASLPRTASGKIDGRALSGLDLPAPETAPGQSIPDLVTAVWTRVLGHDEFEGDDDFFDVGGDSLLATWVVAELGQALDRPLELSLFLEYSTVEDLTVALEALAPGPVREGSPSQVVTLRPGPSGRVLYLLHPLGGELLGYRVLAKASQAPVRLLGIGWRGRPPAPGSSLADIARVHVEQLHTIQPEGPYLLAGWSFGGVLAYEVARQLTAAGDTVDFLGLIDANPVLDPITGLPIEETVFLDLLDTVAARLDDPDADLGALTSGDTWRQLMGAPIAEGTSSRYLHTVLDTARACMAAAMRYEPGPYAGPVHLYQASVPGGAHREKLAAALRPLCRGPLTITAVPGDHWGLTRDQDAGRLAELLDEALENTGATGSGTGGSGS